MPNYGDAEYWNNRYEEDVDSPFDWLFDFNELKDIIHYLIPQKDTKMLVVGAGNAPFSPDLQRIGGYTNITNIDLSNVVINQQASRFPNQNWLTMDVSDMAFADGAFPAVLDKSLVDTLLCYTDSAKKTQAMIDEIYRVMAPGGRYVTFSLHSIEEVLDKFQQPKRYDWRVFAYRVKSSRWNEGEHRRRAVAHTMIVCDKAGGNPDTENVASVAPALASDPATVPQVLSDDDYAALKAHADKVNLTCALQTLSIDQLRLLLFHSLEDPAHNKEGPSLMHKAGRAALFSQVSRIQKSFEEVKGHCELLLQEIAKRDPVKPLDALFDKDEEGEEEEKLREVQ